MKSECGDVRLLLPGYALGALEARERRQVAAHLAGCDACAAELAEFDRVRDGLLYALPPVPPPARVRARLIARTAARPRRLGWEWLMRPAAGLALLALLALNVAAFISLRGLLSEQQALGRQLRDQQTALALVTYPTTKVARVWGDTGYGTLVYDPVQSVAVLNAWGLKPLAGGQTYQAWLIGAAGDRISGGTFQVQEAARFTTLVINAPGPLNQFVGLGVTIEPTGGSPAPTGPRVLSAEF